MLIYIAKIYSLTAMRQGVLLRIGNQVFVALTLPPRGAEISPVHSREPERRRSPLSPPSFSQNRENCKEKMGPRPCDSRTRLKVGKDPGSGPDFR